MAITDGAVHTVSEVAEKLRVDPTTVRRWCKNGALVKGTDFFILPKYGFRRQIRFTDDQFNKLVGNPPASD